MKTGISELSEEEYLGTMQGGMKNITGSAAIPDDIWLYAEAPAVRRLLSGECLSRRRAEAVYENTAGGYRHTLLCGNRKNVYAVIVSDTENGGIIGHYLLDLNEKYGLDED